MRASVILQLEIPDTPDEQRQRDEIARQLGSGVDPTNCVVSLCMGEPHAWMIIDRGEPFNSLYATADLAKQAYVDQLPHNVKQFIANGGRQINWVQCGDHWFIDKSIKVGTVEIRRCRIRGIKEQQ